MEQLLGAGSVQLAGLGTRRRKKPPTTQQPLFSEQAAATESQALDDVSPPVDAILDAEIEAAELQNG